MVPVRHRRLLTCAELRAPTDSHERHGDYRQTKAGTAADASYASCASARPHAPIHPRAAFTHIDGSGFSIAPGTAIPTSTNDLGQVVGLTLRGI
jgi:hypothetical protein